MLTQFRYAGLSCFCLEDTNYPTGVDHRKKHHNTFKHYCRARFSRIWHYTWIVCTDLYTDFNHLCVIFNLLFWPLHSFSLRATLLHFIMPDRMDATWMGNIQNGREAEKQQKVCSTHTHTHDSSAFREKKSQWFIAPLGYQHARNTSTVRLALPACQHKHKYAHHSKTQHSCLCEHLYIFLNLFV